MFYTYILGIVEGINIYTAIVTNSGWWYKGIFDILAIYYIYGSDCT